MDFLDYLIIENEIVIVVKKMKINKLLFLDKIKNEMIKVSF